MLGFFVFFGGVRRIWWFTVSNAADRSRRMRTDERDEALAGRRDSPQGGLSQWSVQS